MACIVFASVCVHCVSIGFDLGRTRKQDIIECLYQISTEVYKLSSVKDTPERYRFMFTKIG